MRFRKKPVEIEARRVPGPDAEQRALAAWCEGLVTDDLDWDYDTGCYRSGTAMASGIFVPFGIPGIVIRTLEGDHLAREGDWVIRGVSGEFYPCKPDIFDATYEPVA